MPNELKPCPFCGGEPITRVRTNVMQILTDEWNRRDNNG